MALNRKQILDKTAEHFIVNDGQPGISVDGNCIYGVPGDTCRCGIGIHDAAGLLSGFGQAMPTAAGHEDGVYFYQLIERVFPGLQPYECMKPWHEIDEDWKMLEQIQVSHDSSARGSFQNAGVSFKTLFAIELRKLYQTFGVELPGFLQQGVLQ